MIIRNVPYRKELAARPRMPSGGAGKRLSGKLAAVAIDPASFLVQQDRRRIDVMVES
jgi:hypothetical protein